MLTTPMIMNRLDNPICSVTAHTHHALLVHGGPPIALSLCRARAETKWEKEKDAVTLSTLRLLHTHTRRPYI